MEWWIKVGIPRCRKGVKIKSLTDAQERIFHTDAAGIPGFGGIFGPYIMVGRWNDKQSDKGMSYKEMLPVSLFLKTFKESLSNCLIRAGTDSLSNCYSLFKSRSRDEATQELIDEMDSVLNAINSDIVGEYVWREVNQHSDWLAKNANFEGWMDNISTSELGVARIVNTVTKECWQLRF